MKRELCNKSLTLLALLCGVWLLTACNGGGGGKDKPGPPGLVYFVSPSYTVTQKDSEVLVVVGRSNGATAAVSVNYVTANGTATAGTDYAHISGTLSWSAGDISQKTISIPLAETDLYRGTRSFTLSLSAGGGDHNAAVTTPDTATIAIVGLLVPATACGYASPSVTATATTGQFYDPLNLSNADGLSEHPAIAVAPVGDGRVFVSWEDEEAGTKAIKFSQSANFGATYTAPRVLSRSGTAVFPSIAVDINGIIHVAWEDTLNGLTEIQYVRSTDLGLTFSAPVSISEGVIAATNVKLASNSAGQVFMLWVEAETLKFARSLDQGESFSVVHTYTAPDNAMSSWPGLWVDRADVLHFSWTETTATADGAVRTIHYAKSTNGGVDWSDELTLATGETLSQTSVVSDAAGYVYVIYRNQDAEDIYLAISSNGGQSFAAPFNLSASEGTSLSPALAVDAAGIVYVAWTDTSTGNYETVFSKSSDRGATFAPPLNFAPSTQGSLFTSMAVDDSQNVYIAWDDNRYPNSPDAISNEGNFEILVAHGRPSLPAVLEASMTSCPFSPNGDGVEDSATFSARFSEPLNWSVSIYDNDDELVHYQEVPSGQSSYVWDGTQNQISGSPVAPDGSYTFTVGGDAVSNSEPALSASGALIVNTVSESIAPVILSFSREAFAFSPNGDGFKDSDGIAAEFNKPVNWTVTISSEATEEVVRTYAGSGLSIDPLATYWDGKNESGEVQAEGVYGVAISIYDTLGQGAGCGGQPTPCENMEIDTTPPQLVSMSLSTASFDPEQGQSVTLLATPTETSLVTIYVYNATDTLVREIDRSYHDVGVPFEVMWDGKDEADRPVAAGPYYFNVWNRDRAGNVALTYPYVLNVEVE